jgi:Cytochrome P450
MINWWAIHYDPRRFPEPHLFKPERFINHSLSAGEEAALADPYERSHFGFGGGRRICPGMHVAERSMFINIARTLWGFNVDFKRDAKGEKIPVDFSLMGTQPGSNCTPNLFACGRISSCNCVTDVVDIRVRSAKQERILRNEWAEAQKVGIDFSSVQFDKVMAREDDE